MTMKAAQEMAKKRWKDTTQEERTDHGRMMADARQAATTPEQRVASAKKAAQSRWGTKKSAAKKKLGVTPTQKRSSEALGDPRKKP
jgi:hypothetical protein